MKKVEKAREVGIAIFRKQLSKIGLDMESTANLPFKTENETE